MTRPALLLCVFTLLGCGAAPVPAIPPRVVEPLDAPAPDGERATRFTFSVDAEARLSGRRATVTWNLTVASNPRPITNAVEFILHAPPGVAFDRLALDVKPGRLTSGQILPARSAAAVYERVTRRRIDPALLERIDAQRYRLRIFPMDRARTVQLRYHAILPATPRGMLLEIPRPHLVAAPTARPNSTRLRVAGRAEVFEGFTAWLPFDAARAETTRAGVVGTDTFTQFQVVLAPPASGARPPVVLAVDRGLEAPADGRAAANLTPVSIIEGNADTVTCRAPPCLSPDTATDLVRLIEAAAPAARAANAALVLATAGLDRWHDLDALRRALPSDLSVHVWPVGARNLSGLAQLAAASNGHLLVAPDALAEARITDLRVEMLAGEADWLPLPRSHLAGAPIVLTARHAGPFRARLHGRIGGRAVVMDLPTPQFASDSAIPTLWHHATLDAAWSGGLAAEPHQARSLQSRVLTRTASLAVFERDQDYTAAARPMPRAQPIPPQRDQPTRVLLTHQRIRILERIYFKSGKARVQRRALPLVDEIAEVLIQNPSIEVAISGHTDSRERDATQLGLRRAFAVAHALTRRGVEVRRLTIRSDGASRPLTTERTREGRATNRRVDFWITAAHGRSQGGPPGRSMRPRPTERRQMLDWLLRAEGLPTKGGFKARRARLPEDLRVMHGDWLYAPEEMDALLRSVDLGALRPSVRAWLAHTLVEKKAWDRVAPFAESLNDADMLLYVGAGHACSPTLRCARMIEKLGRVDVAEARRVARAAVEERALVTPEVLAYAPPDLARPALTQRIAHPGVQAEAFADLTRWATKSGQPDLACRAIARTIALTRDFSLRFDQPPPLPCVRAGLSQRRAGWRSAVLTTLESPIRIEHADETVAKLFPGITLVFDPPQHFDIAWSPGRPVGTVLRMTPIDETTLPLIPPEPRGTEP